VPRALVDGGSLGGLFSGCMLLRAGWDVVVIERTAGALTGRGAGLGVHAPLFEGLRRAGARVDSSIGVAVDGRVTLGADGAVVASIDMPQLCTSWRRLHAVLSDAFAPERLRPGNGLVGIEQHEEGISPHAIRPAVIATMRREAEAILCPPFAEVVRITRVPIVQPIYDLESPRLAFGRVALLGDAAFVARPHVGMGAIKAAQDA